MQTLIRRLSNRRPTSLLLADGSPGPSRSAFRRQLSDNDVYAAIYRDLVAALGQPTLPITILPDRPRSWPVPRRRKLSGRRILRWLATGAVALASFLAAGCGGSRQPSHASPAPPRPSRELVGVMFDGPVLGGDVSLDQQMAWAVRSGVQSLRVAVHWPTLQPYRSFAEVPPSARGEFVSAGGVPTRFADLDRLVAAAAAHGLSLLPVVEDTPSWDALRPGDPASPPKSSQPYAAFLTALVDRYGPSGRFWAAHPDVPRVPLRMWQIWNEPHFADHWSVQPFAPSYVALLAAAHAAVKAADPGAQVVLAGLADFSWQYLTEIYRVPGASRLFDVVAIHPYTAQPRGVIVILQRARAVMDRFGDSGKPLLATELTWPSSQGKAPPQFGVSTTEGQQAQRLNQVVPLLLANRASLGLEGFYWYTWMGNESRDIPPYAFDYAGLLKYVRGTITPKPALEVFTHWALTIERCRPTNLPCRPPPVASQVVPAARERPQ